MDKLSLETGRGERALDQVQRTSHPGVAQAKQTKEEHPGGSVRSPGSGWGQRTGGQGGPRLVGMSAERSSGHWTYPKVKVSVSPTVL